MLLHSLVHLLLVHVTSHRGILVSQKAFETLQLDSNSTRKSFNFHYFSGFLTAAAVLLIVALFLTALSTIFNIVGLSKSDVRGKYRWYRIATMISGFSGEFFRVFFFFFLQINQIGIISKRHNEILMTVTEFLKIQFVCNIIIISIKIRTRQILYFSKCLFKL